jgi:hypothetical protein
MESRTTTRATEHPHLALNMSDATPARDRLEGGSTMKLIKRPASLKATARALNNAHAAVGSHQAAALEHAITCGALLYYAKSQVRHGEWAKWVLENFDGSQNRAGVYMQIAVAYSANPQSFEAAETIEAALLVARELPKPTDLPPELPGLMMPPRPTPEPSGRPSITDDISDEELLREKQERLAFEERMRNAQAERRNKEMEKEFEDAIHPDTPAGNAARKAEKLIAKAVSTQDPESSAFISKALDLIRQHALEVMVVTHG